MIGESLRDRYRIWARMYPIELNDAREPEIDWLAAELSDWLEIPIIKS